jgi:hypothetical protein
MVLLVARTAVFGTRNARAVLIGGAVGVRRAAWLGARERRRAADADQDCDQEYSATGEQESATVVHE